MFLDFKFKLYAFLFEYGTDQILAPACLLIALFLLILISLDTVEKCKSIALLCITAVSSFIGARILHVLIEKKELLKTPEVIFSKFDGMTFNGSLLFGFITFYLLLFFFKKNQRAKYWDMMAIISALSYGILRIGCFAKGCCWGAISSLPWSVKYYTSKVMPMHGIPVHPVQLYDSILGFLIFCILIILYFKNEKRKNSLFPTFLFLYAIGRFYTEFFRGDSFRGEHTFLNFSTSQTVSIGLLFGLFIFYFYKGQKNIFKLLFKWGIISSIISGCLPHAPETQEYKFVQKSDHFEIYQTYNRNQNKKNILFLAGDDNIQFQFSSTLKALYKTETPPSLEDLVYWEYQKDLKNIYNIIVRLPTIGVGNNKFHEALKYMESLNTPYDLAVLTHGMPNYLSTGKDYFFSYKDLENLKGKLSNLNLVMLQSCFGQSLARDFKEAGAKHVLSYPDFNRNFFFFGFFFKYYYSDNSVEAAYLLAKNNFDFQMDTMLYDQIARILLSTTNQSREKNGLAKMSKSDFIQSMPAPSLD